VEERASFEHKVDTYTLSDGTKWHQHFLFCSCQGLCSPHQARPLICRIYPYFPIVNMDGELVDFEFSSLMDLCYTFPERDHPCTLVRERAAAVKQSLARGMSFLQDRRSLTFAYTWCSTGSRQQRSRTPWGLPGTCPRTAARSSRKFECADLLPTNAWKKQGFVHGVEKDYQAIRLGTAPLT
jgi:hypothetical protein